MSIKHANAKAEKATMISHRNLIIVLLATLVVLLTASSAQADVRIEGFETSFDSTQAGAAADYNLKFTVGRIDPDNPASYPSGVIKEQIVDVPEGFVGDPTMAVACPMARITQYGIARCPLESVVGVSVIRMFTPNSGTSALTNRSRVYRLVPARGEVAAFGFNGFGAYAVRLSVTVDPSNDYRVRLTSRNQQAGLPLVEANVTMWGIPAEHQGPGSLSELGYTGATYGGPMPASTPRKRFTSVPTRCDQESVTSMQVASWQYRSLLDPLNASAGAPEGCEELLFSPAFEMTPASKKAEVPSADEAPLQLGQSTDPALPRTPNLEDAEVTLPEGVRLNPSFANGLHVCTDEQLQIDKAEQEQCSPQSKIGEATLESPVLDDPVKAEIFSAEQLSDDPQSGQMYRIFLVGTASGVKIKLEGRIEVDPQTGQITAKFLDNPDLPLERMTLDFKGGQRAPLINPPCGEYSTESTFTSWAGQSVELSSPMTIDEGCEPKGFEPKLRAGSASPQAGAYSPFSMSVIRPDGDEELKLIDSLTLPEGLVGKIASIPTCADQQADAGNCPDASRIGHVQLSAGAGSSPIWLPQAGKDATGVYLTGSYKGAPYGLAIEVPAQAGPFDLGEVVVRGGLHVDPRTAQITAKIDQSRLIASDGTTTEVIADALPRILKGIIVELREVRVIIDREEFMLNPTDCSPQQISAQVDSYGAQSVELANRFTAVNCATLGFSPNLDLSFGNAKKDTKANAHPQLNAKLHFNEGDANISSVEVALPQGVFLDQERLGRICSRANYAAETCPEESVVGYAKATTPLLDDPVEGPVYLKASDNTLPDLAADLNGQIDIDLFGKIDQKQNKKGLNQIRNTFDIVPDVPVSDFELTLEGGDEGLLVNSRNICKSKKAQKVSIDMVAHNGMATSSKPLISSACKQLNKKKASKLKAKAKKLLKKAKKADDKTKAKQLRKQARKLKRQARKLGR